MSRITRFAGLLVIGMLFSVAVFGQTIKGMVKDSTGSAVPYASVNLKNRVSNSIIAYAVTDNKGAYLLRVPAGTAANSVAVEVRCIGFKNQVKPVTDFDAPVDFTLSASVNQLQGVTIRSSRPILKTSGDTTSYKVSDYSNAQDRVIGDVIKKMPGIAVAADGTISYNGKTISNLYIGGDNLLDDKYNIATNTIPNGVVDNVQVIQNHQPIKMLQNKVMSDDVALNLDIKKNAKLQLVGQESVGAGLPGNYDEDLNAMMFKDKYKGINYLKGNNTGFDVQEDLVSHNYSDYLRRIDNDVPSTVLSLGTVNDPNLERNRYLFDQSGIINLNNLVNIKKGVQLKTNLYYLHDTQRQDYTQQTTIFLPGDTVRYNETQHNRFRPDILHGQFTLNINKDKYYLNDILLTDYSHQTNYSALNTNGTPVNQVFKDNTLNFSNEFNLMQPLKSNNIIEVYSYVGHSAEPEDRVITSGYNADIFNNGIRYAQLGQTANVPAWFTNDYFSFKIPGNVITQSFKAGFNVQSQKLTSVLSTTQNNGTINLESDSAANNLSWTKEKLYGEIAYDIPGKILKLNLTLPLSLQRINYSDSLYSLDKGLTRLYFSPQLRVKYQTGIENFVSFLYNFRNEIGNIQDVYRGDILRDYRTLYANNADLTERKDQLVGAGFNYRKALILFFFSVNAIYDHISANNIASSVITNDLQQRIVLPFQNGADMWTISGTTSKYSFALRTTFSAGIQWQSARSNQIQNNTLLPFNTTSTTFNVSADIKVSGNLTASYKANLNETSSHSTAEASTNNIKQLLQQGAIEYNPATNLFFKLSGEHYLTYQRQNNNLKYFFADASMKVRLKKFKTDLELSAVNFLNVKNYSALYLSANTFQSSSFTLPGRIVMFKMMFNI
jgi:hypothetical protein